MVISYNLINNENRTKRMVISKIKFKGLRKLNILKSMVTSLYESKK